MLFTIAIPCYNNVKTIGKAIRSAIHQDYISEYEILVANNASTDGTKEQIEQFDCENLRVINNPTTVNLFANHNVCLREAKGDYVVFCHSDDELLPQALTILEDRIKSRLFPQKYVLWGRSMFRDYARNLNEIGYRQNTILAGEQAIDFFIMAPRGLTPSGTCYSRKSIIELGGFDE
ncbi:MAG: glycosyltransferase family 2 protein, partial [Bacteroidaceae bacterium]|nr:glycosyltransferase family 2 protein [Bacteroidaceae bacterium]